jgi:hypothetical protein
MIGFVGGAIGADIHCDRSGILARTIGDCARILDALKNPDGSTYDPRDLWTAVPRPSVLPSYAEPARASSAPGALKGMRIGIIRESMLVRPGEQSTLPITTAAAAEIKRVLGERLGATLVESSDPLWQRDREFEQMNPDFRAGLARLVPMFMPDLLFRLGADGTPLFKEFAAAIRPTEFQPGKTFGSGTLAPVDYMLEMAEGRIAPPANLDIGTIQQQELANTFGYQVNQYLSRRAADWRQRGFKETLTNFKALNDRSKFWGDDGRAAFRNWEEVADPRNPLGGRQGVDERIMLRELLRRLDMMVLLENRLDAFVRLHTPLPPAKIGGANDPLGGGNNLQAQRRRQTLPLGAGRSADAAGAARPAVLAGVPRRAGPRARASDDRLRLRNGFETPHPAAGLRSPLVMPQLRRG